MRRWQAAAHTETAGQFEQLEGVGQAAVSKRDAFVPIDAGGVWIRAGVLPASRAMTGPASYQFHPELDADGRVTSIRNDAIEPIDIRIIEQYCIIRINNCVTNRGIEAIRGCSEPEKKTR
jgi:hypothetical protein